MIGNFYYFMFIKYLEVEVATRQPPIILNGLLSNYSIFSFLLSSVFFNRKITYYISIFFYIFLFVISTVNSLECLLMFCRYLLRTSKGRWYSVKAKKSWWEPFSSLECLLMFCRYLVFII